MARVVANIQNYMFASMIKRILQEDGDFSVTIVEKPENTFLEFNRKAANIVLMEVKESGSWKYEDRIELCKQMRKTDSDCKLAFLVDEQTEPRLAAKVRQAKIDGWIDQFIYSSISETYLLGIMETI